MPNERYKKYLSYSIFAWMVIVTIIFLFNRQIQFKKEEEVFLSLKKQECVQVGFIQAKSIFGEDSYTYSCKTGKTFNFNKKFDLNADHYTRY